jgi:non-specific protein-tyrosine kinase
LSVVAEATPPTHPSNRNLPLALLLSVVVGLVAGIVLAFLAENLTRRVRTGDEIERAAEAPVLCTVPPTRQVVEASTSGDGSGAGALRRLATFGSDSDEPHPAAVFNSGSAGEEAFRRLATALLAAATKRPFKTLLVTSADPGAGKTTVVANVGRALAQSRRAVLLVDANLRWPHIHDVYGLPNDHGLSDLLVSEHSQIVSARGIVSPPGSRGEPPIHPTSIPGLWILPSGNSVRDPAMLLGSPEMERWTDSVAAGFDYVIFDSPALLAASDAATLARTVDAVLLVTPGGIDRAQLGSALRELQAVDAHLIGVVVNEVAVRRDRREPADKPSSVQESHG